MDQAVLVLIVEEIESDVGERFEATCDVFPELLGVGVSYTKAIKAFYAQLDALQCLNERGNFTVH